MNIRTRFLIIILPIMTTGILFVSYIINHAYYRMLLHNTVNYSSLLVEQTQNLIVFRSHDFEDSLLTALQNWNIFENYLNSPNISDYTRRRELRNFIVTYNTRGSSVNEIYLYNTNGSLFYYNSKDSSVELPEDRAEIENIYQKCLNNRTSKTYWFTIPGNESDIYFSRKIYCPETFMPLGVMIAGIPKEHLQTMYEVLEQANNGSLFVFNPEGEMIIGDPLLLPILKECNTLPSSHSMYSVDKENYIFQIYSNSSTKWTVAFLLSERDMLDEYSYIRKTIFYATSLFALFTLFSILWSSHHILLDIQKFGNALNDAKTNGLSVIHIEKPSKEIRYLEKFYNELVETIKESSSRLAAQQKLAEENKLLALQAEYQQLRAMVNPHFIYNAMESINSIAKLNSQNDIVYLCSSLARLMRISLSKHNTLIALQQELSYLKDYLNIQKYTMGNRLEVVYDLDESLMNCACPSLLLQPIAENCIVHGFPGFQNNVIYITTQHSASPDQLIICIADNGIGMSDEKIAEIYEASSRPLEKNSHIGLVGSIRRMHILYGDPYGVYIRSSENHGTTVEIHLPIQRIGEDHEGNRTGR